MTDARKLEKPEDIKILWAKAIAFGLAIVTFISCFIIAPKRVFSKDLPYTLATSLALTTEENFLLHSYKVYGSEDRFNDGLISDVAEQKEAFKTRNEILAVKIYGAPKIEVKEDYLLIQDTGVPDLNIEYYIVQNLIIDETSLPCRTFIMLLQDVFTLINTIYFAVLLFLSLIITLPSSIKLTRIIIQISKSRQSHQ